MGKRPGTGRGRSGLSQAGCSRTGLSAQVRWRNTGIGCAQKPQKRMSAGRGQSRSAGSPLGGRTVAGSGSRLAAPARRHGCAPEPYAFWRRNGRCESLEPVSNIKPPGSLRSTAVITTKKLPQRPQICPLKDFKSCKTPVRGLSRPWSGEKSSRLLQNCRFCAVIPSVLFTNWPAPSSFPQGCPWSPAPGGSSAPGAFSPLSPGGRGLG